MVVGGRLPGDATGRGIADVGPQRRVGQDAVIGDAPPLCVHVGQHVGLDQSGQGEVLGGERAHRVVGSETPCVLSRCARIEVDADKGPCLGVIGTLVAGCDVVMRALESEDTARSVRCAQPHHRGGPGTRDDDAEALGPQQRHRIQFDRKGLVCFVNRPSGLCGPYAAGIDASMSGVEEHRLAAITLRRLERFARAGGEDGRVELRLGWRGRHSAPGGDSSSTAAHGDSGGECRPQSPQTATPPPGARHHRGHGFCIGFRSHDPSEASPQLHLPLAQ
jgi:hypothetical protein